MSCGVERDTGARLRNDLVWEAHYLGGAGKWGAWQLGRPEGGKLKGQSWEPTSPPPRTRCGILPARSRVTSQARAAERAGHHQRRESTRAWVDGGAGCEGGGPRIRLLAAVFRIPASPRPKPREKPEGPGEPSEGLGEGACPGRGRCAALGVSSPPPSPSSSSPGSSSLGSATRPRAGALRAEVARAAARGRWRRAGRGRAGWGGRCAPTQAAARGDPGRRPRPLTCLRRKAACRPRDPQAPPRLAPAAAWLPRVGRRQGW